MEVEVEMKVENENEGRRRKMEMALHIIFSVITPMTLLLEFDAN